MDIHDEEKALEEVTKAEKEVRELEEQLERAKERMRRMRGDEPVGEVTSTKSQESDKSSLATHFLFLLSDSALPLGAFAFSSGLESYVAHTSSSFTNFLPLSISSFAATTLPYCLAAHRNPSALSTIDDALDAAMICTVGRRASVAQGRALLALWDKSFMGAVGDEERGVLGPFVEVMKRVPRETRAGEIPLASGHLAGVFGAVARLVGVAEEETGYVFVLAHVRALLSAAVRANMFGPFMAQRVLAAEETRRMIGEAVAMEKDTKYEEAGQRVPVMDLWMGRHELLYSRIFNS